MDQHIKEKVDSAGLLKGFFIWLTTPSSETEITTIDRFNAILSRLAMTLTSVAVVITFFEVVMRYVFFSPTLWVNELTLWMGSVIFLMSGVYAMQQRSHIRIHAAYDLFPPKVRKACDIASVLVICSYCGAMVYASYEVALKTLLSWERFGTFWNPPIPATIKPLVLIATILVAVQAINNLFIDSFSGKRRIKPGQDDRFL